MILDHPNARLAKAAWVAVSAGDADRLSEIWSEDVVWHVSGRGPRSGTYKSLPAVFDYLASIGEDAERFDLTLEDVLVGDEYASVLFRASGKRGDRQLDTGYILLCRIEADRIVELWSVPRDQHAVDEFWA